MLIEEWKQIDRKHCKGIKEISNTGKVRLFDGTERPSGLREHLWYDGKRVRISRLTITMFNPDAPKRDDQDCVDHITHNPVGMNVNDVRNLRWCNNKENHNFEEARRNNSAAKKGNTYGAGNKGKKRSAETCAKLSASHKDKKHSPETKAKMSASMKDKKKGRHWHLENGIRVWTD